MAGVNAWLKDPSGLLDDNEGQSPSFLQQDMSSLNDNGLDSSLGFINTQGMAFLLTLMLFYSVG